MLCTKKEMQKPYFVDKSEILKEMIRLIEEGGDYICITRPRRFGKTVTANMIAAYFSRLHDAADLFDGLDIAADERYCKYRNRYPAIHISFNDMMPSCSSYGDYIGRIEQQLIVDLEAAFPNIILDKPHSELAAVVNLIYLSARDMYRVEREDKARKGYVDDRVIIGTS